MFSSIFALLFFTGWTILLVLAVGTYRTLQVLAGQKKANEFPSGTPHGSDLYWRVNRAHMNSVEALPVFAILVLATFYLGFQSSVFETLAWVVVGARILQTSAHLSGGGEWHVNIRFTGFLIQYVSFAVMLVILARSIL